jgi:hypothetical protein
MTTKLTLLLTTIGFLSFGFSQNKKQQIELLTFQVDSLKNELKIMSNNIMIKSQNETLLKSKLDSLFLKNSEQINDLNQLKKSSENSISELKNQCNKDLEQKQNQIIEISKEINKSKEKLILKEDEINLTNLVWKVNDWYKSQDIILFEFVEKNGIILNIDWEKTNAIIGMMKEIGFFTDHFILTYQNMAVKFDAEIKKIKGATEIDLFNIIGEVDFFCNCQDDMMLNYEIHDLKINNQSAKFNWRLDADEETIQNLIKSGDTELEFLKYTISAKFIDGKWKIDAMEGFEN